MAELGDGSSLPSRANRSLTVDDLIDGYLEHLDHDKGRRHSTLTRYRGLQKSWIAPALGSVRGDALTPGQVERLLGAMRRADQSHSSMYQTLVLLNGTYKWAKRNRRVRLNPIAEVEVPQSTRVAKEIVPPDVDALLRLLRAAADSEEEFGLACHLGAVTGMRRGELCGLRWSRVDIEAGALSVESTVNDAGGTVVVDDFTKTRRTRRVGLDPHTVELLRQHHDLMTNRAQACGTTLAADAFVLSHDSEGARPIRPEYMTRRMRQLRSSLGMDGSDFDATLQALRHWTQTALSEAGYNSRQVARRGGHSEQLMNRVYVHQTKTADDEMASYVGALLAPSDGAGTPSSASRATAGTTNRRPNQRDGSSPARTHS